MSPAQATGSKCSPSRGRSVFRLRVETIDYQADIVGANGKRRIGKPRVGHASAHWLNCKRRVDATEHDAAKWRAIEVHLYSAAARRGKAETGGRYDAGAIVRQGNDE